MKKLLTTLACGAMLTSVASADMMRIEGGAGIWQQKSSGDASYTETGYDDGEYKSKEDTYNQGYVWLMIKHPIPIVPNLRVEYVGIEDEGDVSGHFDDYTAHGTTAKYEMKQYDIIPYYNILDNTGWTTIDLGIDLKVIDSTYTANNVIDNSTGLATDYSDSSTVAVPLLYVRARVEFPYNMAIEGIAKYIGYGDTHIIDTVAKFDYTMEFVPVVHPAIEVGYRYQSYKFDEDDSDGKVDLKFGGFFAGVMLRY